MLFVALNGPALIILSRAVQSSLKDFQVSLLSYPINILMFVSSESSIEIKYTRTHKINKGSFSIINCSIF